MRTKTNIIAYVALVILISCKASFEPIDFGKDACTHCKMTIVDKRYAAEILTGKGRAYKFDDIHCLRQYLKEHNEVDAKAMYFVAPYEGTTTTFLDASKAVFIQNDFFTSPMNGHYAAFSSKETAQRLADSLKQNTLTWDKVE
ncbi:MAG: nitrous oxide reductase accessory protein NosL [Bacteroidetes bacterium]|nr:nitrous oxide reductase accessory protein NosL [Bacteroidota bacterium]